MKPFSDFTTPRKLICPISRHFFPVEHPEPVGCCTTGLKNGSRLPLIAHFFSSGFGASALLLASAALASAEILVAAGAAALAAGFGAIALAATAGCFFAVGLATPLTAALATGAAGAAPPFAGAATGITAPGFAVAPGAGFAAGVAEGVVFVGCTAWLVFCTLLITFGFCAQSPPVISPTARMPVVSFIAIPICPRPPQLRRVSCPALLRP